MIEMQVLTIGTIEVHPLRVDAKFAPYVRYPAINLPELALGPNALTTPLNGIVTVIITEELRMQVRELLEAMKMVSSLSMLRIESRELAQMMRITAARHLLVELWKKGRLNTDPITLITHKTVGPHDLADLDDDEARALFGRLPQL